MRGTSEQVRGRGAGQNTHVPADEQVVRVRRLAADTRGVLIRNWRQREEKVESGILWDQVEGCRYEQVPAGGVLWGSEGTLGSLRPTSLTVMTRKR